MEGFLKKGDYVPEEVMFARDFTLKECSEIFHAIESAKKEMKC